MAKNYCPCKTCTSFECEDCTICDTCLVYTGCINNGISGEEKTEIEVKNPQ